eukprot:823624-Prymnesium_polylepis.1
MVTVAKGGCAGVEETVTPMKTPLEAVIAIASDIPVAAACAAASVGVVIVAVTAIDPAAMERLTAVVLTPAALATAAV